jgi:hypothetical protein
MEYRSNINAVKAVLRSCKSELCTAVGTLSVAEVQRLVPVDTGNLRRSIASGNMPNNEGIYIGAIADAPYALTIEKGLAGHRAQPYLEPGAMQAIPKIVDVAERLYRSKMGGS